MIYAIEGLDVLLVTATVISFIARRYVIGFGVGFAAALMCTASVLIFRPA